jgi:serine/threonine protein kinase
MEYVDGEDLARVVAEKGPQDPALVLQIMIQATRALSYAFSKGKIHRDIKPANLLLTRRGTIKLSDFGLIKGEGDPGLTGAGPIMGTPFYMSPEVVSGSPDIDIRGDIYSLGATVFHLLTGLPPFAGNDMPVVMTKQITETIEIPANIRGPGGDRFRYVISKMLSKRREIRYQTPDDLLADLEKLVDADAATSDLPTIPDLGDGTTTITSKNLFTAPTIEAVPNQSDKLLSDFQLSSIQEKAPVTRKYLPGTVLFYEGDGSRDFYILNSGKCEVLRSGKRLAIINKPGATFGEMSAILGGRRTATIRALEETVCTIIPLAQFKNYLAENPDMQQQVLEAALTRLQDLNEKYVQSQNAVGKAKMSLLRTIRGIGLIEPEEITENLQTIYKLMNAPEE